MSTPIKREDIRKGDKIRLTSVREFISDRDSTWTDIAGTTYELIERPMVLPVVPGIYEDAEGNLWRLHFGSEDVRQEWTLDADSMPDETVRQFAPFTLLRPVTEVAAEVLAAIRAVSKGDGGWFEHQLFEKDMRAIEAMFGVTK